jgi:hypothetical protein
VRENLTEGLLDYLTKRPLLLRVSLTVNNQGKDWGRN